ncbi:tetratricopeptide repeat protein [Aquisphaera insulae]|uniref:tetratricopeptide repeat protein n=1 Tax=Aquisphaera insulae TaxID=2712864 RepID=UPI0013ECD002|nr:tetratricopeptide repeat protein [Aquisphaera insulae]
MSPPMGKDRRTIPVTSGRGRPRGGMAVAMAAALLAGAPTASPARSPGNETPGATVPATPEMNEPKTVSVDVGKLRDPNDFKKDVTPGQRLHTHLDLGRALEVSGEFEAALAEYQQALASCERKGLGRSRSADEALAHRRIAGALDRMGRFAQSEVHFKRSLALNPRDPKTWNDLGYSDYLQGRWADSERALRTALKLAPEDERATTNLGLTLAAAGRTDEAMPLLSRYSGDAIGHANLGYLLAATGQVELARQQYLQALALRPSLAVAHKALAQLDRGAPAGTIAAAPRGVGGPAQDPAVARTAATSAKIPPPTRFAPPASAKIPPPRPFRPGTGTPR